MSAKKCCRACLKEIRNRTTFTNLLEPPDPIVHLRNGVEASSYLQCYYFCLRSNSSHFNLENLPDYSYICGTCKGYLLKAVDFIVQSQRNEGFLMSMYDISKEDSISEDIADNLLEDYVSDLQSEEEQSIIEEKEYIIEEYADEPEILEDELLDVQIYEFSNASEMDGDAVDEDEYIEYDDVHREESCDELEIFEEVIAITSNDTETKKRREQKNGKRKRCDDSDEFDQAKNSTCKTSRKTKKIQEEENRKWKTLPKKTFNLEFKCLLCRTNFDLQRQLYEHYDNEHDQQTLTFPCDICKRRHISQKALTFHKHSVHNNIEYEDCELCGQVILPAFFKAHKDRHTNAVQYACYKCDRTFDRQCTMKQHHRAVHEKEKLRRYECQDCDRHFFSEEKLKVHIMVHDENTAVSEVDFLCHICSKTFVKKIDLQLHLKVHSGNIIKCPHCGKEFVRPKDMEYHMRTHTKDFPFKCNVCSRGFAVRWSFDAHMKQHEGLRYKCEVCDKEYIYLSALRVHSYEHRGYPLSCKICGKGYGVKKKLRNHLKNTHLRSHDGQHSDGVLDEYIVRNKIPHLYVKGEYVDEDSDIKD